MALCFSASVAGRAQAQIPEQAYISGVAGHAQAYSLSCEARSAADWSAYWGVSINESEFLNSLPRSDNPNEGFVGDPNDPWGYIPPSSYGVHAEPIAGLLREYGLDAHASMGLGWTELQAEVAAGRPVIVWVIGSIWSGTPKDFETEDGEIVTVANNEHTMILIGYDETRVHLVDALTGYTVTHSLENFLNSWAVLGNMAVTGEGSGTNPNEGTNNNGEGYIVQPGDTLNKVAARFDLDWPDLAAWNNISFPYLIYPGQVLSLSGEEPQGEPEEPAQNEPQVYRVKLGDHLVEIARRLRVGWVPLARLNGLAPPFNLERGMKLTIPETGAQVSAPAAPDTYTATRYESLVGVARFYGLDWITLAGQNNISYPYILNPGQTIEF